MHLSYVKLKIIGKTKFQNLKCSHSQIIGTYYKQWRNQEGGVGGLYPRNLIQIIRIHNICSELPLVGFLVKN